MVTRALLEQSLRLVGNILKLATWPLHESPAEEISADARAPSAFFLQIPGKNAAIQSGTNVAKKQRR
jgi:hypothetical protein